MRTDRSLIYLFLLLTSIAWGCKTASITTDSSDTYKEDLDRYLPSYSDSLDQFTSSEPSTKRENIDVPPTHDHTEKIDGLIMAMAETNGAINYIPGFTIQVYSGRSKQEAQQARQKIYAILPGVRPRTSYKEPNYKVRVGSYYTRLDAQTTLVKLKAAFPESAILVPENIPIN
jgi:hypothetical protein